MPEAPMVPANFGFDVSSEPLTQRLQEMTAAEKKKAKKKAREKAKKAGGDADDAAAPAAAKKGGKKVIHCCSAYMPSVVCALVTALSSRTHLCSMFTERTRHFHDCNCLHDFTMPHARAAHVPEPHTLALPGTGPKKGSHVHW